MDDFCRVIVSLVSVFGELEKVDTDNCIHRQFTAVVSKTKK